MTTPRMSGPTRGAIILFLVAVFLTLLTSFGSLWLSLHAIDASQHKWCTTLELIQNARPPHPTASQARYFNDLRELEREFGC